ncbi:MAG: hypothetical protein J0H61_02265 [Alphaproteobacteria bacterium]|nr:hypothetical protein [Alphaproteobacteria bacterium]
MMDGWIMWNYGWDHWMAFAVIAAILLYPIGRILGRMGLSPFWSIVMFIPVLNLIALWVIAFADWPSYESPATH